VWVVVKEAYCLLLLFLSNEAFIRS
jgi:hypothetical protein